jgi:hypothetical protein
MRKFPGLLLACIMAFAGLSTISFGQGELPFGLAVKFASNSMVGLYNPNGLQRWRDGLCEVGIQRDGSGLGGVDVVFWTDSYPLYNGYSVRSDTCVAALRNLLQDRYNPVMRPDGSRYGGAGYLPVFGGATNVWTTHDPKDSGLISDATCSYEPVSGRWFFSDMAFHYVTVTGGSARLRWDFDGTDPLAIPNRDRITDAEIVASRNPGHGTLRLDAGAAGAFVASNGASGTVNCNGSASFGKHWGRNFSGLNPLSANSVQITAEAGAVSNVLLALIAYCDDWDKGVRVHNVGNPGTRLLRYTDSELVAAIDAFSSSPPGSAPSGATRAKLFVMDFILNDCIFPGETASQFLTRLRTVVARIKARPSRPSLLYIIPPAGVNAERRTDYPAYIQAIKTVMWENTDCMTVFDFGEYLGDGVNGAQAGSSYSLQITSLGWSNQDGSHLNNLGQKGLAQLLFRILN